MELRLPFYLAAGFCLFVAVLLEVGASELFTKLTMGAESRETPGFAINFLALIDGIILYSMVWNVLSLILPQGITGRAQGCITLILSFFALLGTIALILFAFGLLMLMIGLLVAVPFGTIAYLAAWGHFARGAAAATLTLAMLLKIAFLVLAVLAHQRFLQNKGLLVLIGLSMGLTWVIGFVHAFLPIILVSIGDTLLALVIAIIAAIWLLLLLIGSIVATIKAILSLRRVG